MPSLQAIVHPRLLVNLFAFYPSLCTIQVSTPVQDVVGELQPVWANVPLHVLLPCRISPVGGQELKMSEEVYGVSSHTINLRGFYPAIAIAMRALIDLVYYDILSVEHDGNDYTTRLQVQVVI